MANKKSLVRSDGAVTVKVTSSWWKGERTVTVKPNEDRGIWEVLLEVDLSDIAEALSFNVNGAPIASQYRAGEGDKIEIKSAV
jgi:hypothetical protein